MEETVDSGGVTLEIEEWLKELEKSDELDMYAKRKSDE